MTTSTRSMLSTACGFIGLKIEDKVNPSHAAIAFCNIGSFLLMRPEIVSEELMQEALAQLICLPEWTNIHSWLYVDGKVINEKIDRFLNKW